MLSKSAPRHVALFEWQRPQLSLLQPSDTVPDGWVFIGLSPRSNYSIITTLHASRVRTRSSVSEFESTDSALPNPAPPTSILLYYQLDREKQWSTTSLFISRGSSHGVDRGPKLSKC